MKKPKKIATMNKVWANLMAYAMESTGNEKRIAEEFNVMLDRLLSRDFFGSEGQCDPRGDNREG